MSHRIYCRVGFAEEKLGRSVVYAVAVNCLKNPTPNPNPHPTTNPIRNPTTNPIPNPNPTNPIPYSSGNLLLRRKLHYARKAVQSSQVSYSLSPIPLLSLIIHPLFSSRCPPISPNLGLWLGIGLGLGNGVKVKSNSATSDCLESARL